MKKKKFSKNLATLLCNPDQPKRASTNISGNEASWGICTKDDPHHPVDVKTGLKGRTMREL